MMARISKKTMNGLMLIAGVVVAIYWNQRQTPAAPNMYNNPAGMKASGWY